jgi:hypothetical protein
MSNGLERRVRSVRIVHFAMLTFVVVLVPLGESAAGQPGKVGLFLGLFGAAAAVDAVIALLLRKSLVGGAEERLQRYPEDAEAALRWQTGQFVSFAMAESVALFGLVLRVLGATLEQAAGFYAAGIGLLLIFWPRPPR